ncbi:MAG TPA: hypothetical protein VK177_13110 [Flavobacteriales bacterium]|nr:hypothetical protein [Flavobacteriales bacterium]
MKKAVYFLCIATLAACGTTEKEIPDGGPCSYKITTYPATVIDFFGNDSTNYTVYFTVKQYSVTDTVTQDVSPEEFNSLEIKKGSTFTWEVKEITNGHCSPHLEWLKLVRYKE